MKNYFKRISDKIKVDALDGKSFLRSSVYFGLLSLAAFLIYLPFELGVGLTIPPDSSEYSICLANLFEQGRYGFTLNGEWYPSRYTPWFSLFCLMPAYFLSGCNALCLNWSILVFALALLALVWKIGMLCGLKKLSVVPPMVLMFMPDFIFYSRVVMTEIPYATFVVVLALVFLRFMNHSQYTVGYCFCIGLLIAVAGLVRSTGFALILPFALAVLIRRMEWNRKLVLFFAFGIPIVAAQILGLTYNWMMFGNPFRSGYHYWLAVPHDFPSLVFNLKYVVRVGEYLLGQPVMQVTIAFLCASLLATLHIVAKNGFTAHRTLILLEGYVLIHLLVLSVLYLGYYWADTRFFLPVTICSVVMFFATWGTLLSKVNLTVRALLVGVTLALSLIAVIKSPTRYLSMTIGRPVWLAEAQIAGTVLPPKSVVLQMGEPSVVDYFGFRDKGLILFPFDRKFDYTSHMTAARSVAGSINTPKTWETRIVPELIDSGVCGLPFPAVFAENPDLVRKYVCEGKRVFFLQGHFCRGAEFDNFKSRIESMGLAVKLFGVWNLPVISPNPARHMYDKLLFPDGLMDSRPEITVACFEIVSASGVTVSS